MATTAKQGLGTLTVGGSSARLATYSRTGKGALALSGTPYDHALPLTVPGRPETLLAFPLFVEVQLPLGHAPHQTFGFFDSNRKPLTATVRSYNAGNRLLQADVLTDLGTSDTTVYVYYS